MSGFDVSLLGALLAGLASFVSPCVLPLVPPYLCFLAGLSMEQLAGEDAIARSVARRVLASAGLFVAGFTTVFVIMGAAASAIGRALTEHLDVLSRIAGVVIIVLGLHFLGLLRLARLDRDLRFSTFSRPAGLVGAYVVGLAFAFGWTPCVGPVLAAILFVAGAEDTLARGATLLAAYSLGIGVPFLLAALAMRPFLGLAARIRPYMPWLERIVGAALVATGVLFITGSVNDIGFWLLETFPALGRVG